MLLFRKFPFRIFWGISSSVVFHYILSLFFFKHVRLASCWVHPMLSVNVACASVFSLVTVVSGSRARPSYSCDRWVCDLGVVGDSSIFGLVRGTGAFTVVFPTFVLVSRIQLAQQYRDNGHFLITVSSS
jgi:hypothetical protein